MPLMPLYATTTTAQLQSHYCFPDLLVILNEDRILSNDQKRGTKLQKFQKIAEKEQTAKQSVFKTFCKVKTAGFMLVRGRRYTQNWKLTPCETTHLCEEEGQKTTETALMLRTALLIYQCQCTNCLLCGMAPSNHVPRGRDHLHMRLSIYCPNLNLDNLNA